MFKKCAAVGGVWGKLMFSTKFYAADFAGDGLGQFGYKLDDTWILVGRGLVLDVGLNVFD